MKTHCITSHTGTRGFISAKAAIVLAVITGGAGLLIYEWHNAHPGKTHSSAPAHHHSKNHESKTAASK